MNDIASEESGRPFGELVLAHLITRARRFGDFLACPPSWVAWTVFALAISNVLAYVLVASDPLVVQDAWYFLDVFVRHALDGTLSLADFFVKRGGFDHAQPLRKLILLVELRHFRLDMRVQAVAGVVAAAGCLLLLRWLADSNGDGVAGKRAWWWSLMCVALVTLNSRGVWDWPLVAGAFTSYVFLFALIVTVWRALAGGRFWPVVLSAVTFDIIADDTALIVSVAALLALAWLWIRDRSRRRETVHVAILLLLSLFAVRLGYHLFLPSGGGHLSYGNTFHKLLNAFVHGGWWQWAIIPLASSIAHVEPLREFAGAHTRSIQIVVGLLLVMAHIWFWVRTLTCRPNRSSFAAVVLMLMFYAMCAGIIFGRVAQFGNGYLNEPRYVLFYGFGNVALLLMACAGSRASVSTSNVDIRALALALLAMLGFAWQGLLARHSWMVYPYVSAYYQKMAQQIGAMARNPEVTPAHCAPELPICGYSPAKRRELIGMLQKHRLNVFSKSFQRSTRLYPYLSPVEGNSVQNTGVAKGSAGTR